MEIINVLLFFWNIILSIIIIRLQNEVNNMDQDNKTLKEIANVKKLLEKNQIIISQLSFDVGELKKRADILDKELEDLFKK